MSFPSRLNLLKQRWLLYNLKHSVDFISFYFILINKILINFEYFKAPSNSDCKQLARNWEVTTKI